MNHSDTAGRRHKALFAQAATLFCEERWSEAEALLDVLLRESPKNWPGLRLKAMLAAQSGRQALAIAILQQLVLDRPDDVGTYLQLGELASQTSDWVQAEEFYRHALAQRPHDEAAVAGMGHVLQTQGRLSEALALFQRWRLRQADRPEPYWHMGHVWLVRGESERALAAFERAASLAPDHVEACSNVLYAQHYVASVDLAARQAALRQFSHAIMLGVTSRFAVAVERQYNPPLRIGFVSADFRQHPVGMLIEPLLRALDRRLVTPIIFANQHGGDVVTTRLQALAATWVPIVALSDIAAAQAIMAARIDILIDLSGHTKGQRLGVFAQRPAPLQISWLGYFASTGVPVMDYVLADPHCVLEQDASMFSERILRLPHSRFCFATPSDAPAIPTADKIFDAGPGNESGTAALCPTLRYINPSTFKHAAGFLRFGMRARQSARRSAPASASRSFTFGSFQDVPKINDQVLAVWARVLRACPQARLRVQSVRLGYREVREALAQRMQAAGIALHQVILLGPSQRADYWHAYAEVDLLLDTFPYPGGMTTLEALWMGVPTLSLERPGMLGRQGAALLRVVGLSQYVCQDSDAYVAAAIVAERTGKLGVDARRAIREQMRQSPLMDVKAFAAHWQQVMRDVWCSQDTKATSIHY